MLYSMLQFPLTVKNKSYYTVKNGFYRRAKYIRHIKCAYKKLFPTSLAVTKGILVSFYYCTALNNMFKFSAYPRSS